MWGEQVRKKFVPHACNMKANKQNEELNIIPTIIHIIVPKYSYTHHVQ